MECEDEFSKLINKSLGLAQNVDRGTLDEDVLEQVARRENLVRVLESRGKTPSEIRRFIKDFGIKQSNILTSGHLSCEYGLF